MNSEMLEKKAAPFLRWAGGKRWLLKHLEGIGGLTIGNYHEAFLGGGAVFFHLENYTSAYLSDLNEDLIETYVCVKEDLENVIDILSTFKNTEAQYYKIREKKYSTKYERAAKFIYLNKTSFNGIYRVNRNGIFNVPYGFRRKDIDIVDEANLREVNKKLQKVKIDCTDFEEIIKNVKKGDFVFLDPPYTVAHENNGFIEYNQKLFSLDDQKRLCQLIQKISEIGAYYVLTNAKHTAVKKIYKSIDEPIAISRISRIGGTGARREEFKEYIFTNCPTLF